MHHNSQVRTTAVIDSTSSTTIVVEGAAPPRPANDQAIGPDEAHAGEPAVNKADANES